MFFAHPLNTWVVIYKANRSFPYQVCVGRWLYERCFSYAFGWWNETNLHLYAWGCYITEIFLPNKSIFISLCYPFKISIPLETWWCSAFLSGCWSGHCSLFTHSYACWTGKCAEISLFLVCHAVWMVIYKANRLFPYQVCVGRWLY